MLLELNFKQRSLTLFGLAATGVFGAVLIGQKLFPQLGLVAILVYLATGSRPILVYSTVKALPRDLRIAKKFITMNIQLYLWERDKATVATIYQSIAKKYPNKPAFMMDDYSITFQEGEDLSNRVANLFKTKAINKGDTVALLMENRPEYSFIWLGLAKLGIITALVNTNLRKDTLIHSITVANSKAIIVGSELADAIKEIRESTGIKDLPIYQYNDKNKDTNLLENSKDFVSEISRQPTTSPIEEISRVTPRDKMVYIFTSGTTGLPKAAVITNLRYMFMTVGCNHMLSIKIDDIIYNPLPLYHTAGGMVGSGNVLLMGVTMALRKKFSASNFWPDCIKYKATMAQYIGELCRYLLAVPVKPTDTQHKVRMMFGNGLRPQIWPQFISRFNIEMIGEFYGSTEGNSNLVNTDGKIGAVGFVPRFAKKLYPVTLVRCDEETGEPLRNSNGRCMRCNPGESGVFLGKISPNHAVKNFEGYADKKASEKKIIHDVFKKGDLYFNSGDILVMDAMGYFYFKDRTGDTFRWRGENVATSEVEAVISNVVGLKDCAVYGVEIPDIEGKAGMAAIVDPENKIDFEQLSVGIRGSLPSYARPLFLRILDELPMTGTFKLKKIELQSAGYDLKKVKEPIYFLNSDGIYRRFTEKDYDDVVNGRARL